MAVSSVAAPLARTESFSTYKALPPNAIVLTDAKIRKIWLVALASLALIGAAIFTFCAVTVSPWLLAAAIPLYIASIASMAYASRIIDYDDPIKLAQIREEASRLPLMNAVEKHTWDKLFRYEILSPAQFDAKYRAHVGSMQLKDLIDAYDATKKKILQANVQDKYVLPRPSEWKHKLADETGGFNFYSLVYWHSLPNLIRHELITPEEFVKAFNEYADASTAKNLIDAYWLAKRQLQEASHSFNPQFIQQFSIEVPKSMKLKFHAEWGHKKASEIAVHFSHLLPMLVESQVIEKVEFVIFDKAKSEYAEASKRIGEAKKAFDESLKPHERIRDQAKKIAEALYRANAAHKEIADLKKRHDGDVMEIQSKFRVLSQNSPEKISELSAQKRKDLAAVHVEYDRKKAPYESILDNARRLKHEACELADREFLAVRSDLAKDLDQDIRHIEESRDHWLTVLDRAYDRFRAIDRQ